ncbi:DUF4249 domain-containing protein [Hymenobacter sp. RP-2-7]|uniref:DUF4249 domain-containing protein n=1 Tax=Hymenobacter polaris TaxID=2682546 RepID=A0A7Y0AEW8_9BACT|nr:DUF4249 domain-containing protein [Hymenobacter polaris]NML66083.1 DUF4249 domain-containing protein [Hymenobacter polaris]
MSLYPRFFLRLSLGAILLGLGGCVESYVPDVATPTTSYLVVDGFINGNGATRIHLARTIALATTSSPPAEKGARLFIFDDQGTRYALTERSAGFYQSDSLLLNPARQYQLRITTAGSGAANYESDLVPLKVTPAIDKLDYYVAGDQVQLRVSTHDATAQSRYYRWSFVETWEFNAAFHSNIEYYAKPGPGQAIISARSTPIYTCWRTERPTDIVQTTSAQLSQDALTDYVVRTIPARAERFKVRYSVLVSEYVETAPEFAYNELLRKNTEAVGTINDPLPVQLTGNVHRVGNAEPVLGYVGAHTLRQQRLFISRADLPARALEDYDTPYNTCQANISYYCDPQGTCDKLGVYDLFRLPAYIPLDFASDAGGDGILGASAECADCRLRGSNVKPSFW